jgi:hypothetical protein
MRTSLLPIRFISVVLVIVLGSLAASPAHGQDERAQLSSAASAWIGTPPPADCIGPTASVDAIVDALSTTPTLDGNALPLTIPTEADLPPGEPAGPVQVEATSAILWQAVACLNGGSLGQFFALFSPEGIRAFYYGAIAAMGGEPVAPTAEQLAEVRVNLTSSFATSPTPVADAERGRIDRIRDARILPDGRLLFVIEGSLGVDASLYMVFRLDGDRWLVDAFGQIGIFETGLS